MKQTEPPSCSSNIVLIGKNRRGGWVAQERNGRFGGLFVSRAAAVKFALFENGHHPDSIIDAPSVLELDLGGNAASDGASVNTDNILQRRAA